MDNMKLTLSTSEAAEHLGVSRSQIYRLICSKELASITIGRSRRIPMAALEKFIAERLAHQAV